ncbi:MAG TPA: branched-chain amino acid ABC transporter permease [Aliidongia sp.]|uniref:branched-chain amino acid ABC transporter permease n=1 Tax=Aliidongia sp. TaxID=1914230 RepID=UPI002DDCDB83|nr:branched-chain amino acid ABC transporter permease [Aliidongia sp.]HEV2673341.1 branched-chain amino acid ABC transporter permease [Aliidongia sp.]
MELSLVVSGIETGAFYGLVALGYFLFLRATAAVNFAMGAYVMFAGLAYGYFSEDPSAPLVLGLASAFGAAVLFSWITEDLILRPMARRARDEFGAVMAIVALMFVIEQLAGLAFGRRPLLGRELLDGALVVGSLAIDYHDLLALVATLGTFAAVAAWLKRGRYGRMLRAVGDNEAAARALGLPVRRVRLVAVIATGLICGLAGILVAPQTALSFQSHLSFAILGFIALVLGGVGTPWAPLVGGMLVSAIEAASARYIGGFARDYVLLALVILVFSFRPEGLFTVRVRS